ncbi:MAG: filamentous hemagglutinin N-terminal domain-containing protein [Burkholderiaceae bacterium]|nr:filamentous hemagglutinin N-terminal domain-containing protein [Burkholderiaceae bacterium]MEB2350936.1 filamentous hemagglutinin N-terminal domain-containing protein [Burkholderiaceae bacterium]
MHAGRTTATVLACLFAHRAELGATRGPNLFHSSSSFSLQAGERAIFTGPSEPRNVIARVTGGVRPSIDGALRSEVPGASLYFRNPSGVPFGPNASLRVEGSFWASTADLPASR